MRLSQARGNRSQAGGHTCRPYNGDGVGAFGKGAQTARPHGRAMHAPTVKTAARFRCRGRWSGLPLSLPGPHCGRFFRRRRRVCSVGRSDSARETHRRPPPGEAGVTSIYHSGGRRGGLFAVFDEAVAAVVALIDHGEAAVGLVAEIALELGHFLLGIGMDIGR